MTKTVACVIARTNSTRLPLKVLRDLLPGVSVLDFLLQRISGASKVDEVYICTSTESSDDILEDIATRNGAKIYRGSPDQVIERMQAVRRLESADYLLRLTGDNPFIDPVLLDEQIDLVLEENLDYVRLTDVPIGATGEVIRAGALDTLDAVMDPDQSEYMMLYLFDPDRFECGIIKPQTEDYSGFFATIDTPEDLVRAKETALRMRSEGEYSLAALLRGFPKPQKRDPELDSVLVKMPHGITTTYAAFQEMMQDRKSRALTRQMYDFH